MNFYLLFIATIFLQEIPFKSTDQFEIKLDYQFKPRPLPDANTVQLAELPGRQNESGASVLPYLVLHIKLLELPEEKMRVHISNNLKERTSSKKISDDAIIELDLGFTDDMIDRVSAHQYVLTFVDSRKIPIDRIVINVDEDGSFFVNGEKRGQF